MPSTLQYSTGQLQTAPNRFLWAAVGALGATSVALGVALVQMRTAPSAPETAIALSAPSVATPEVSERKVPLALVKSDTTATKNIANKTANVPVRSTPAPTPARSAEPLTTPPPVPVVAQTPPPPPKAVCAQCGTVVAVTPVKRDGAPSGAGVVAGALLGGLLGNQVGGGTGKTIATVAGAVGGGYAGNTVEKRMKKVTVYRVDVRMDDGSGRRVEHSSPVSVGANVTINGDTLSQ